MPEEGVSGAARILLICSKGDRGVQEVPRSVPKIHSNYHLNMTSNACPYMKPKEVSRRLGRDLVSDRYRPPLFIVSKNSQYMVFGIFPFSALHPNTLLESPHIG